MFNIVEVTFFIVLSKLKDEEVYIKLHKMCIKL